jgi:hypothetical protein
MSARNKNLKDVQVVTADMLNFETDYVLCFNEETGQQNKISLSNLTQQMNSSFVVFPQQSKLAEQAFGSSNHSYPITIDLSSSRLDSSISSVKNISSANLHFIFFAETQDAKNIYFNFSYYTNSSRNDNYRTVVNMIQTTRNYKTVNGDPIFIREGREFNIPVVNNKIYLSCSSNVVGAKVEIGMNCLFTGFTD